MSLYFTQKFLYELNRDNRVQDAYRSSRVDAIGDYELTETEQRAIVEPDIGLLYHLGVNGQILMHFAAFHDIAWADYLEMMRVGLEKYGPVREGVYAVTGYEGTAAHNERLGHNNTSGS